MLSRVFYGIPRARWLTAEVLPAVLSVHVLVVLDVELGVPFAPDGDALDALVAVPLDREADLLARSPGDNRYLQTIAKSLKVRRDTG